MTQRLDKWVSSHTALSRKEVKTLVAQGKITINGTKATNAAEHLPETAELVVNGQPLRLQKQVYLMMNKPTGVVSATKDNWDTTVIDILPEEYQRADIFPVGRLDKDTEGLLFLTNDGDFAHRIASPNYKVPKTYLVTLDEPTEFELVQREFAHGLLLGKGEKISPAELVQGDSPDSYLLTIYEGVYHQVKRMFGLFGRRVIQLKRLKIGEISLDNDLKPGGVRQLTAKEEEGFW